MKTGVYGNPFAVPTGPTAHYMPIYPLLLAAIFRVLGTGVAGELGQYTLGIACSSLMYSALPVFANVVGLPLRIGIIAGVLGAAVPIEFLQEIRGGDTSLAAVFMIATVALFFRAIRGDLRSARAALIGLLVGVGTLTNPSVLAPAVGLFILVAIKNGRHMGQVFKFGAIAGVICIVVLSPWAIRNYFALGYPVLLRSNLGIELQVSNNDLAEPRFEDAPLSPAMRFYHPFGNPDEAEKVRALGEVAYNREKIGEYKQWAEDNPVRFFQLIAARFVLFWFPVTHRLPQTVGLFAISILAFCGMVVLRRSSVEIFRLVLAIWLTYPDLYYFIQSWSRYRMPIEWTFLCCAAVFLDYLRRRFRRCQVSATE